MADMRELQDGVNRLTEVRDGEIMASSTGSNRTFFINYFCMDAYLQECSPVTTDDVKELGLVARMEISRTTDNIMLSAYLKVWQLHEVRDSKNPNVVMALLYIHPHQICALHSRDFFDFLKLQKVCLGFNQNFTDVLKLGDGIHRFKKHVSHSQYSLKDVGKFEKCPKKSRDVFSKTWTSFCKKASCCSLSVSVSLHYFQVLPP